MFVGENGLALANAYREVYLYSYESYKYLNKTI